MISERNKQGNLSDYSSFLPEGSLWMLVLGRIIQAGDTDLTELEIDQNLGRLRWLEFVGAEHRATQSKSSRKLYKGPPRVFG